MVKLFDQVLEESNKELTSLNHSIRARWADLDAALTRGIDVQIEEAKQEINITYELMIEEYIHNILIQKNPGIYNGQA